ncbi:hypothetical protein JRO89_XS01G0297800 [Xanthoceras sorbifolium]|uniref:Pectinesterase inhibitor domain-containing protein n=1 Tax=Xanthoceras sorbifolium TaxID=99658 RepID=A0ABQ8IM49_9ROSI|nr:hypothetical protein JRO89_XS01G0297800 [Xanthoceras sorbifolium]
MSSCTATTTFYLLLLAMVATAGCTRESEMVQAARAAVLQARNWARAYSIGPNDDLNYIHDGDHAHREALRECAGLYEVSESRLAELLVGGENYTVDDARAWLSGVLAYHSACLDGLEETGFDKSHAGAQNLSVLVGEALSLYAKHRGSRRPSGIWGDGFWARDMTFENTVGPHQAVALRVASDLSTDLDGIIHPKGWTEWKGSFALSTLYYAEYLNKGVGALTANRVKWNGFHVLNNAEEASPFTVSRFIHGENWIPETGVPFSLEI